MEQINDIVGSVFDYLRANPKCGLLLAILLVLFYGVGLLLNWDWTLQRSSSSDMVPMFIEIFGERAVRVFMGVLTIILLLSLIYLYFAY